MSKNTFTIIKDSFSKEGTDEIVEGLTIIIDGKLKQMFDIIINEHSKYIGYSELMSDVILLGINKIIEKDK